MPVRWHLYRRVDGPQERGTSLALLVVFFVVSAVMKLFCQDQLGNSPFWPANGVIVVGILVLPRRTGWVFCAACFAIDMIENAWADLHFGHNLEVSALNIGLSFLTAFLTRTFCGAATDLLRVRRLVQFAAIVMASAALEAFIGELLTWEDIATNQERLSDWLQWTDCDGLGLLSATPAILLGVRRHRALYRGDAGRVESGLLLLLIASVTLLGFTVAHSLWLLLVYPILTLIAFRAGPPLVLAAVLVIAVQAAGFSVHGIGPIAAIASPDPLSVEHMVQLFLLSIFGCAVPATYVLGERNRTAQLLARSHEAARAARASAEAANTAKSQFVATVSHEIRTPLNGVLGMAMVMAADDLSEVQRGRVQVIRRSGEMLLSILNDLLDLSKIEAGKLTLEAEPFLLDDVAASALAAFSVIAAEKSLSFALSVAPEVEGAYLGDSVRVRQILYNLISNALKFTEHGGVTVAIKPGLEIKVIDTGIGIPAHRLGQLFQKFEQAEVSTSRRFGGSGLGLSICRELAEMMDGTVTAESVEGQGSIFTAHLPLERIELLSPSSPPPPEPPVERPVPPSLRVLAAEDNKVNQLVLSGLLKHRGITPVLVDNGSAAVAAWAESEWDVILMDMQMPLMDGLAATREIRTQEAQSGRRRTPIVALTAALMANQIEIYTEAGMDGFVSKPFDLDQLLTVMDTVRG
jgi:signal transduction histidine kinase/CheY-like chemotaxis protein